MQERHYNMTLINPTSQCIQTCYVHPVILWIGSERLSALFLTECIVLFVPNFTCFMSSIMFHSPKHIQVLCLTETVLSQGQFML